MKLKVDFVYLWICCQNWSRVSRIICFHLFVIHCIEFYMATQFRSSDCKVMDSETQFLTICPHECFYKFLIVNFFRRRIVQQTTGAEGQQCGMACSSCSIMWSTNPVTDYHVIPILWQTVKMSHDVTRHTAMCHMMWQLVRMCDIFTQRCDDCLWLTESLSNETPPQYLLLIKLNGADNILNNQMRPFLEKKFTILKLNYLLKSELNWHGVNWDWAIY